MSYYIACPYCGDDQEIDHDDGYGYDALYAAKKKKSKALRKKEKRILQGWV